MREAELGSAEDLVAVAEQHVREGEAHVAHQREIMDRLEKDGHKRAALMAREVLATLLHSLDLARVHLELERQHLSDGGGERAPGDVSRLPPDSPAG